MPGFAGLLALIAFLIYAAMIVAGIIVVAAQRAVCGVRTAQGMPGF